MSLNVSLRFRTRFLNDLDLLAEVRSRDLQPIASLVLPGNLQVEKPGEYFVSITFPNGKRIHRQVTVEAGKPARFVLELDEAPSSIRDEFADFLALPLKRRRGLRLMPQWTDLATEVGVRSFHDPLGGQMPALSVVKLEGTELVSSVQFEITGARNVQVFTAREVPINILLPGRLGDCHVLVLEQTAAKEILVEVRPRSLRVHALQTMLRSGLLTQASEVVRALVDRHRDLVLAEPTLASVVGLALLRFGSLEGVEKLLTPDGPDPEVADSIVIAAELSARKGDQNGALRLLTQLAEVGLPGLPDALGYALDRLNQYLAPEREIVRGPGIDAERLTYLRGVLQNVSNEVIEGIACVAWRGLELNAAGKIYSLAFHRRHLTAFDNYTLLKVSDISERLKPKAPFAAPRPDRETVIRTDPADWWKEM